MLRKIERENGTIVYEARVKRNGRVLYRNFASAREATRWVNEVRFRRDNPPFQNVPVVSETNLTMDKDSHVSQCGFVSVQMMFDKYLEYAEGKGRAGSTLKQHRDKFTKHIRPFYKNVDMKSVSHEEHECFFNALKRKRNLGNASRNRIRALMSVIYSTAIRRRFFDGVFRDNPFTYIEKLAEEKKQMKYWDIESMTRFIEGNRESHYYPLWLFLLNTGLRIGEACAVHREQIDFAASIVSIDRTWSDHENVIVHRTKSRKIRHVGLNDDALHALSLIEMGEGQIFRNPDGTPILPDHIRKKLLPDACNKAGVINIGPHGFRRSYGAVYMMGGGNIWDLSKVLGHSSVQLTEKYYAQFSREHVLKRARIITRQNNVISANFGVRGG